MVVRRLRKQWSEPLQAARCPSLGAHLLEQGILGGAGSSTFPGSPFSIIEWMSLKVPDTSDRLVAFASTCPFISGWNTLIPPEFLTLDF